MSFFKQNHPWHIAKEIMTFPFHDLPSFCLKKSPGLKAGNVAVSCPGQNLTSMHQIQVGCLRVVGFPKHNRPKNPQGPSNGRVWTCTTRASGSSKYQFLRGSGFLGRDLCETWLFSLKKISDSFKTSEICGDFCKKKLLRFLQNYSSCWVPCAILGSTGLPAWNVVFCKRENFHRKRFAKRWFFGRPGGWSPWGFQVITTADLKPGHPAHTVPLACWFGVTLDHFLGLFFSVPGGDFLFFFFGLEGTLKIHRNFLRFQEKASANNR